MSNETDLDWLARNVHKWDKFGETLISKVGDQVVWSLPSSPPDADTFTKAEWLARRAELQDKPSWEDAPEWVGWLAQDKSGSWWFFRCHPKAMSEGWDSDSSAYHHSSWVDGEVLGDWRDTLEKRPADLSEQAVTARLQEATNNVLAAAPELMTDKYKFEPFVSVEDAATAKQPSITPSKYTKTIHGVSVDVYDVLQAWGVTNPALQHLIKKAMQCGQRGHKDNEQDLQDIIDSAIRAKELG